MFRKSFTLFEIIISIILISIIYIFAINNFSKSNTNNTNNITLKNLKSKLTKYEYQNNITIKCIKDNLTCFIFLDSQTIPLEEKIEKLFFKEPNVYDYNKDLDKIEFLDLELEGLQRYEVIFKFTCRNNNRCSELVVETENGIFVYNDIYTKPMKFDYLTDVEDIIEKNIQEVKDAF